MRSHFKSPLKDAPKAGKGWIDTQPTVKDLDGSGSAKALLSASMAWDFLKTEHNDLAQ